jgi:hypothetical protein
MNKEQELLFELSDKVIDIINHKDEFVTGDLQGAIEAVISKAILGGEAIAKDNKGTI